MTLYALGVMVLMFGMIQLSLDNSKTNLEMTQIIDEIHMDVDEEIEFLNLNVGGCYERKNKNLGLFCYEMLEDGSKDILLNQE